MAVSELEKKTNGVTKMSAQMSPAAEKRIAEVIARYPKKKSAVMNALYIVQEELGFVTDQGVAWIADRLAISPAHVREVATFYTMYYKKPVGQYHIQVCRTLSCMLCGARDITSYIQQRLQLAPGQISRDGLWSYEEVECLGSCGTAPMVEINDIYFENLTVEKLTQLMNRIEQEKPDLRYSAVRENLGEGIRGLPKSEVWKAVGN